MKPYFYIKQFSVLKLSKVFVMHINSFPLKWKADFLASIKQV
jgi:hypothetical protein